MIRIHCRNPAETAALGKKIGSLLQPGDFLALYGDLGAGKTYLAKAIAAGIGVGSDIPVTSPTFTLLNEYAARIPFYHFDLYRLDGEESLEGLGFDEFFYGQGACVVEWPERLGRHLPDDHLEVRLEPAGDEERIVILVPHGARYSGLLNDLRS